jgi:DNA-binding transcriptional LysR family regulator
MTESIAYNSNKDEKRISIATTALLSGNDLIVAFKKTYPEILVSYNELFSPHFRLEELSSQYDFLISSEENTMDQNLSTLRLFSHPPVLLVPISHPIANRQSISLAECSSLPIINSISTTPWAKYVDSLFKQANLRFKPVMECPYDIRIKLVGDGIGVTLASETSVKLSALPLNVVVLRIDDVELEHAVWLYWSKFKKKNHASKIFIEFARQYYH